MNAFEVKDMIKSDLKRLGGGKLFDFLKWYFKPLGSVFPYQVWMRIYQFLIEINLHPILKFIPYCLLRHYEYKYGIHGGAGIHIGKGLLIVHGDGVYLNCKTIGDNFTVYQGVTLGKGSDGGIPIIGNNVTVYPNSVVCGGIIIGDNVTIGANAFVSHNVGDGLTVAGIPAKIISDKNKMEK